MFGRLSDCVMSNMEEANEGGPVSEPEPDQDETMLFILRELEKLQLLVGMLRDRGVISDNDFAVVELQAEVRENERLAQICEKAGHTREAAAYRKANIDLERKISALQAKS